LPTTAPPQETKQACATNTGCAWCAEQGATTIGICFDPTNNTCCGGGTDCSRPILCNSSAVAACQIMTANMPANQIAVQKAQGVVLQDTTPNAVLRIRVVAAQIL